MRYRYFYLHGDVGDGYVSRRYSPTAKRSCGVRQAWMSFARECKL